MVVERESCELSVTYGYNMKTKVFGFRVALVCWGLEGDKSFYPVSLLFSSLCVCSNGLSLILPLSDWLWGSLLNLDCAKVTHLYLDLSAPPRILLSCLPVSIWLTLLTWSNFSASLYTSRMPEFVNLRLFSGHKALKFLLNIKNSVICWQTDWTNKNKLSPTSATKHIKQDHLLGIPINKNRLLKKPQP